MKIKIIILLFVTVISPTLCQAQSREPPLGGSETPATGTSSTSTGVWTSVSQSSVGTDSSVGYDSGDHGNVS